MRTGPATRRTTTSRFNTSFPAQPFWKLAYVGNKGTRMWGGSPGSGYTDYNGLPSSLLAMGDILNDPVSDHPQFLPFPTFRHEPFRRAGATSLSSVWAGQRAVPVQHELELQLAAGDGDQAPDQRISDSWPRTRSPRRSATSTRTVRRVLHVRAGLLQSQARSVDHRVQYASSVQADLGL